MLEKIINETSDFINFKFPGLNFISSQVFQQFQYPINIRVKDDGLNPRKNMKILFENEAEILKSQALMNKKNHSNLLNLANDLVELLHYEDEMLVNNENIYKLEKRYSKDLASYSTDIKLLIEVINANITIDSKPMLYKIIQKELMEINQKLQRLQSNYQELKECEIDSFFNIPDFIKSNNSSKYFEGYSYDNSYPTLINFFEMSSINLNHACKEAEKVMDFSNNKHIIDENLTMSLFFEVQKMIIESQKFFIKNESNIIACIIFAYDKLMGTLNKYIEVII